MKNSGYKMKGYSYPGKSPLKQTKFPNSPDAIKRRERNKNKVKVEKDNSFITPHVPGENDLVTDQMHMLPEVKIAESKLDPMPTLPPKKVVLKGARPLNEKPLLAGMPTLPAKKVVLKGAKPLSEKPLLAAEYKPKTKKVKLKKDKRSTRSNDFVNDLVVGAAVAMLSKERKGFTPVNIAGKQNKIM